MKYVFKFDHLSKYQERIVFNDARHMVVEAATKTGKTSACIVWLLYKALTGPKGHRWWVAPVVQQADIAFERIQAHLPKGFYKVRLGKRAIELANGNTLWFKSAHNPDTLYGEDVQDVVIDEASRTTTSAWTAIRSTLTATNGATRIIGNVKGRGNWMYQQAIQAQLALRREEEGTPALWAHLPPGEDWDDDNAVDPRYSRQYDYLKVTAWDATKVIKPNGKPLITPAEIRAAKRELNEERFQELYMAEAAGDGSNPFGFDALRACLQQAPPDDGRALYFGVDLGRVVDYTAVVGINWHGDVVVVERFKNQTWAAIEERIIALCRAGETTVDATGVGDAMAERLDERLPGYTERFKYTNTSKAQLIETLAMGLREGATTVPPGPLYDELEVFEYTYTAGNVIRYSAPEGHHDDLVNAYALAWRTYMRGRRLGGYGYFATN